MRFNERPDLAAALAAASESEILSRQHEKDIELAKKHLPDKRKELDDYKGETPSPQKK